MLLGKLEALERERDSLLRDALLKVERVLFRMCSLDSLLGDALLKQTHLV